MMEDLEKMLTELSKPEVKQLRHQAVLGDEIVRAKDRNAVSLWWLLVPLYVIAVLTMKTLYTKTSLKQEVTLFSTRQPLLSFLLFVVVPVLLIVFSGLFSSRPSRAGIALTIVSSVILLIYILTRYV